MATPSTSPTAPAPSLPAALRLGPVTLTIADKERSIGFYRDFLGLSVLNDNENRVTLGVGNEPLLHLDVQPGVGPSPRRAPGLYHAALLLPDRLALAKVLYRLASAQYPIGASDHLVSEALYLDDPDGNGLEIYRDRAREEWPRNGDQIEMATLPLKSDEVLAELERDTEGWNGMPAGTTIGHVHLRVADVDEAVAFYTGVIGFDLMILYGQQAAFMSAGGYHHHLGANSWESSGVTQRPENVAGLARWDVILPTAEDVATVHNRVEAAGAQVTPIENGFTTTDPWGTALAIRTA